MDAMPDHAGSGTRRLGGADQQRHRARTRRCSRGCTRLPQGGTAVGTGINAPSANSPRSIAPNCCRSKRACALQPERQLLRGAVVAGHRGGIVRPAEGRRGQHHEDRQRPALDEQRSARRSRRNRAARAAARQQHHAGQGQPGDPRSRGDGCRAGDRQRRRDHDGRPVGQLPAERDAAGDRATTCCRASNCWRMLRACLPTKPSPASPSPGATSTSRSRAIRFWSPRSIRSSATRRPPKSRSAHTRKAGR